MKSLYRRYRPTKLEEVVGQEQVTGPLSRALTEGKVSHAYLLIGPRGCGKTSVARILAHEVNGFKYEIEDDYVDIIEIDGASNRGIDDIRELREKVAIAPTSGKYKVYIIDEVHMLTKEAFNALLKTLEEPPEHVIFIMATTDPQKVPVTILSRAQTYTFKLANGETMLPLLKQICEKEKIKISDEALLTIIKRGGGSFRDTLSLLDQISTLASDEEIAKEKVVAALGLPEDEKINELLFNVVSGDVGKITTVLKDLLSSGIKAETLAEEIINSVIEDPRPEYLALLSKLTDVKAPFAEAKLLVALVPSASEHSFSRPTFSPSTSYAGAPREPSPTETNLGDASQGAFGPAGIYVSERENRPLSRERNTPDTTKAQPAEFNWENFLERVRNVSEALWAQTRGAKYEIKSGELVIYPEKKFAQSFLSRDKNKQILTEAAGVKVNIEAPKKVENDALISEISGIMGGEVIDDGGGNPF